MPYQKGITSRSSVGDRDRGRGRSGRPPNHSRFDPPDFHRSRDHHLNRSADRDGRQPYRRNQSRGWRGRSFQRRPNRSNRYRDREDGQSPDGDRGNREVREQRPPPRSRSRTDNQEPALTSVLERVLAFLERNDRGQSDSSDSRPQNRNQNATESRAKRPRREAPRPNNGNIQEVSENPDFAGLVKHSFRYIQATHHGENWKEVPPRVSQQIDKVVANLKPPMPGEDLRQKLGTAADDFKSAILATVQNHVQEVALSAKQEVEKLNHVDWEAAEDKARQRYSRRFTSRARQETVEVALEDLQSVRTEGWQRPRHTVRPAMGVVGARSTVHLGNRFATLHSEGGSDDEDPEGDPGVEAAAFPAPSSVPLKRRKQAAKASTPAKKKPHSAALIHTDGSTDMPASDASFLTESIPASEDDDSVIPGTAHQSRPYPRVMVGSSNNRNRWSVDVPPAPIRNLVLCDSNGRSWVDLDIPENTVVYALRGARLADAARLGPDITENVKAFQTIVINIGTNDRNNDPSTTIAVLRDIHRWSSRCSARVLVVGIPPFRNLSTDTQARIRTINQTMKDLFVDAFIPPIAENQLHIVDPQADGIHYSADTAQAVLDSFADHLN